MVLLRSRRVLADAIKMATQELENSVCRQFGWSARYFIVRSDDQTKNGCWAVKIQMGLDREKTFVSTDRSNDSNKYRKQGKKAAALVALEGLQDDIQRELIKPIVGLEEAAGIKMATQELENNVCRQFGWSARYFTVRSDDQTKDGCWAVKIQMGLDREKTFVSTDRSNDSNKYRKQGKKAAALVALEGLQDDIQRELIKPIVGLEEAVGPLMAGTSLRVCESSGEAWNKFWRNPPDAVGIDTEGNALSPPVLVQIATDDKVILEAPNANGLSWNLVQLLFDDSIVKVFCDSRSQRDKKSLGLVPSVPGLVLPLHTDNGPVVDIEVLADERMGEASVERGLSKLLSLTMPELGVRIAKESGAKRLEDIGIFVDIEQGLRPPLRSVHELTKEQQNYAALDAWCTLQIWRQLKE